MQAQSMAKGPRLFARRLSLAGRATILLIGLASVIACGGSSTPPDASVERGRAIFGRACAVCHGQNAEGIPGFGNGLHDNAYAAGLSDAELVHFLETGRSARDPLNKTGIDMPPKGGDPTLTTEDLNDLVAYLRTL